jgi:hypothetical protein
MLEIIYCLGWAYILHSQLVGNWIRFLRQPQGMKGPYLACHYKEAVKFLGVMVTKLWKENKIGVRSRAHLSESSRIILSFVNRTICLKQLRFWLLLEITSSLKIKHVMRFLYSDIARPLVIHDCVRSQTVELNSALDYNRVGQKPACSSD